MRCIASLVTAVLVVSAGLARAADGPSSTSAPPIRDEPAAEALFTRAKALVRDDKHAEACPLFEESNRLSPGIGVLLHLGACWEKVGKTARAWAAFSEARAMAEFAKDVERQRIAEDQVTRLTPRVPHLTIELRGGQAEAAQVRRDGALLGAATLGQPLPVDPGSHVVVVSGPGLVTIERTVFIKEGESARLELELAEAPKAAPATTPSAIIPQRQMPLEIPRTHRKKDRFWPLVLVGVGGAGLLTGAVAGTVAWVDMDKARGLCPGNACPSAEGIDLQDRAGTSADIATGALIAGAVTLTVGALLWISQDSSSHAASAGQNVASTPWSIAW